MWIVQSVNPARRIALRIARLGAPQGIAAMQSVNIAILNPLFLAVFMGTAVLSLITGIAGIWNWSAEGSGWLLAGSLFYLVGIIAVTMIFGDERL